MNATVKDVMTTHVVAVTKEASFKDVAALLRQHQVSTGVTAASIMTTAPITITPDEPVTSAARLMYSCKVRSLPVVTENGYLAGIISRADVLSVYGRPDQQIGQEIMQDLIATGSGSDPGRFTVTVKDGIVTLAGYPDTARQGRNILAEAWHIEGVISVRDRLTYPEGPSSDV
jgi:CBS-domain-containing membrane protein